MARVNKYCYRSHISEGKFREIIRLFSLDLSGSTIAEISGISRVTINNLLYRIRVGLAEICEASSPLSGEVEMDESYFGPKRVRGKRGRGAGGKTIVFGILKREGNVYTQIVSNASKKQLQQVIRGKIEVDSIIHTDGWKAYDGLVDVGYEKHFRVNHSANEFATGTNHINGIESFWSYAKRRLTKFNGIQPDKFYLHLKETEFRFNHRNKDLYHIILEELRKKPL